MTKLSLDPAKEALRLHGEIRQAYESSLEKAIRIGEILTKQRKALKHGEFTPWIDEHLSWSRKTVRNYMRVYSERHELKEADATTLTEAYRLLGPKKKRAQKPPSEPQNGKSLTVLGVNPSESKGSAEPVTLDTEGEEVPPEPEVKSEPIPEPEPDEQLDFTDEIFQKDVKPQDDFAELTGETAAEVIEAGGLKPVNVEPEPEGWDTERVLTPELLARVAETIGFSNERWVLGLLEQLGEHPDPVVREGAASGIENHEGVRTEDPMRNALPEAWVEPMYEIYMVEENEAKIAALLNKLLKKVQGLL